jgi:nucleoside-diphosphate-sugar epimerase
MSKVKILVTGGSGFIGSSLIDYYLKNGYECLNLDIIAPPDGRSYSSWRSTDLLNIKDLELEIMGFMPTHVLHMAARTDIEENNDINGYAINFHGVENLIKVLDNCPSVRRVIFASSMLVCRVGYNPASYDDYCSPNLYGESKVLMEKRIKELNIDKYEWIIIRPTSIWGPGFKAPYKNFFDLIVNRRYFKFRGKSATKTFGFIYNSVYQINQLLFLNSLLVNKRTFYIGDETPINIHNWADIIASQLNTRVISIPFSIIKLISWIGDGLMFLGIPFPLYTFRVKNMTTDNVIKLLADTKAIIPEQPYTLEEGVHKTLSWMKRCRDL